MANDRLFIVCDKCREIRTLAKYYPGMSGGGTSDVGTEDWIDTHWHDCQERFSGSLDGNPGFHLLTETSPLAWDSRDGKCFEKEPKAVES